MTDQREQNAIPSQPLPPAPGPWSDYLAAAQRLDAVRRAANPAAGEQEGTAAAQQELSTVRGRLMTQAARLSREGVPDEELRPTPADLEVARHAVAGGPAAVAAALQQARHTADTADALLAATVPPARMRPWARNLMVYGPFAITVLIVQIALYLVAPAGSVPTYALLCGLSMPILAFGLGWATIGFVWGGPDDNGQKPASVDRTPIVGAVVCLIPVLLTCMGVGLASLFRG